MTYAHVFYVYLAAFAGFAVYSGFRLQSARGMAGLRYPSGVLITAFTGLLVVAASRGLKFDVSDPAGWLMGGLIIVGGGGVFASMLSVMGPLQLPHSYEWPVGYVRGVVTTPEGNYVVPLWSCGRVQIYDPQWRFICGWNVDAWGGNFRVRCSTNGEVEVFTVRDEHHYSFTERGELISSERLEVPWLSLPKGRAVLVPTPLLLWIFSSPIISAAVMLIGFAGLGGLNRMGY